MLRSYFIEAGTDPKIIETNINWKVESAVKQGWRFKKIYEEVKTLKLRVLGREYQQVRFVTVELTRHD